MRHQMVVLKAPSMTVERIEGRWDSDKREHLRGCGKEREGQKEGGKRKENIKEQSERLGGDAKDSAREKNQKIKE